MAWKYAKIVYTQITRNTQEPRIMIKIFFHSESSSLYCRMEICWLRWYTPGILRGLEWIRFLFRYRMSDLSPNRLGRLTHRYRWSVRTQRFVFSIRPLLSTKICDWSAISKRSLPGVNLTWLKSRASGRFRRQTKYRRIRLLLRFCTDMCFFHAGYGRFPHNR